MAVTPQMGILDLSPILCPSQSTFHVGVISRQAARVWEVGTWTHGDAWGGCGGSCSGSPALLGPEFGYNWKAKMKRPGNI